MNCYKQGETFFYHEISSFELLCPNFHYLPVLKINLLAYPSCTFQLLFLWNYRFLPALECWGFCNFAQGTFQYKSQLTIRGRTWGHPSILYFNISSTWMKSDVTLTVATRIFFFQEKNYLYSKDLIIAIWSIRGPKNPNQGRRFLQITMQIMIMIYAVVFCLQFAQLSIQNSLSKPCFINTRSEFFL